MLTVVEQLEDGEPSQPGNRAAPDSGDRAAPENSERRVKPRSHGQEAPAQVDPTKKVVLIALRKYLGLSGDAATLARLNEMTMADIKKMIQDFNGVQRFKVVRDNPVLIHNFSQFRITLVLQTDGDLDYIHTPALQREEVEEDVGDIGKSREKFGASAKAAVTSSPQRTTALAGIASGAAFRPSSKSAHETLVLQPVAQQSNATLGNQTQSGGLEPPEVVIDVYGKTLPAIIPEGASSLAINDRGTKIGGLEAPSAVIDRSMSTRDAIGGAGLARKIHIMRIDTLSTLIESVKNRLEEPTLKFFEYATLLYEIEQIKQKLVPEMSDRNLNEEAVKVACEQISPEFGSVLRNPRLGMIQEALAAYESLFSKLPDMIAKILDQIDTLKHQKQERPTFLRPDAILDQLTMIFASLSAPERELLRFFLHTPKDMKVIRTKWPKYLHFVELINDLDRQMDEIEAVVPGFRVQKGFPKLRI